MSCRHAYSQQQFRQTISHYCLFLSVMAIFPGVPVFNFIGHSMSNLIQMYGSNHAKLDKRIFDAHNWILLGSSTTLKAPSTKEHCLFETDVVE